MAVSYTHLDVYKRQLTRCMTSLSNCDGMNRITLIIIFVKPCSREAYHFLPALSPDVYKRQDVFCLEAELLSHEVDGLGVEALVD